MNRDSLISVLAPVIRGCTLPRDGNGRPAGVPACVIPVPSAVPAPIGAGGPSAILSADPSTPDGERAAAKAVSDAFSTWGKSPAGSGSGTVPVPGIVTVSSGSETLSFVVGRDPDDARSRLNSISGGNVRPFVPERHPVPEPGSASRRAGVVKGRVAFVTGGAQGFGEEIVRGLVSSGAVTYVADLNFGGAEKLCGGLNEKAGRTAAIPVSINVTDEESVAQAFLLVAKTTGGLDLCVSNAGVLKAGSVLDQPPKDFRFVTDVNYTGFFLIAQGCARLLRRQALAAPAWMTDIIQINSKSGLEGSNRNGAYAGSKFGGIGLVQSFALELVEFGIKVNAICPGNFFDGPLWSDPDRGLFVQYLNTGKVPGAKTIADVRAFYEAKVPMKRGCTGPDVMRAVYSIVEQEYETGQAVPVTGGQVMLG